MRKIGRPKERRTHTAHSGVKLKQRRLASGHVMHVAIWFDPITGIEKQASLDKLGKTTDEARRDWAISKSAQLKRQRADMAAGKLPEPEKSGTPVSEAVANYLKSLTCAPKTLRLYTAALGHLTDWTAANRVPHVETLSGRHLNDFGKHLRAMKAKRAVSGEGVGRGANRLSERTLAPATVNQSIRGIRTFLADCRRNEQTPLLTSDTVSDCLRFAKREKKLPRFLRTSEARALLEAAIRHDADSYTYVRRGTSEKEADEIEHGRKPIAPFIAAALLSGMRFSELAGLRWADVDLDAGEIRLDASATKTHEGRRITLAETPALSAMLASLKLRAGQSPYVFGGRKPLARTRAEAARKRLRRKQGGFGAPVFTWHDLRRTCGTYGTCAPGIYGGASAYMSAKRLGHSVTISEKFYVGAVTIPAEHKTLEAALTIGDLCEKITAGAGAKAQPVALRKVA